MSTINRRTALTALATAAFPASLAAKAEETQPSFTIPPPPAPPGASDKLLRAIRSEYGVELREFAFQLDAAQSLYRKYPGLVRSNVFSKECFDALAENGMGGPSGKVRDSFMRPAELIAEAGLIGK